MTWIDDDQLLYTTKAAGRLETHLVSMGSARDRKLGGPDLVHPEFDSRSRSLVAARLRSERDLAVIDASGNLDAVASSTSDDHHGVLQPGGNVLAYISRRSGFDEIWLYDLVADTARQITQLEGATIRYPAWHPDGLRLVFTVQGAVGERIYEIDVLTGATRPIGDANTAATTPNWLADGAAVVFGCNDAAEWGICVEQAGQVRKIASGYFHPVALDVAWLAVADSQGALYRMRIDDGRTEKLWDGIPGVDRYGWTVAAGKLYYIDPAPGSNSANLVRRDLANGSEEVLYTGPMPVADTILSFDETTNRLLFTRFQAASDDLVVFDLEGIL